MKTFLYLLPLVLAFLALPGVLAHGGDWSTADMSPTNQAPTPQKEKRAVVQVYGARAFSWRAPYSLHCWIAVKRENASAYTVYQVIGWNLRRGLSAVSVHDDAPDRKWYDRMPKILFDARGDAAAKMIPQIEAAAKSYPYPNAYRAWPGPNSNTFVSHIIRNTEGMTMELPSNAIGKDFLVGGKIFDRSEFKTGYQLSLYGLLGATAGLEDGLEINILGLVFGFDAKRPALKLPMIGRIGMKDE
jgi:hypothetical protein